MNHEKLISILQRRIIGEKTVWLLSLVISSFSANGRCGIGLPLGNLTSQLFANVYMNEFDQFVKHRLKAKFYIRYADDFVIFSYDKSRLEEILRYIVVFLEGELNLEIHPYKISIRTLASGVDFLGWVHFPDHRVLRTATKRKMLRAVMRSSKPETIQSYLGLLSYGNTQKLQNQIL